MSEHIVLIRVEPRLIPPLNLEGHCRGFFNIKNKIKEKNMQSVKYFNEIAGLWNNIRADYFEENLKEKIIDTNEIEDKVCADLGCGTGFISLELAKYSKLVFAVDQSKNMLVELNRSATNGAFKNIYPITGKFESIPLFDKSMDHVFTNMALHHVEDPFKAITEMHRILKKGGVIHLSDVEAHNGSWAHEEMYDVWLGFEHEHIRNWLEKAGFEQIHIQSTGLYCQGYSSKGEYTKTGIFLATAVKSIGGQDEI